jgi:steroid delta-isomerase-like uncharacterized protein
MVADHVDLAQRYVIDLWEERDLAVVAALVDEEYVRRDPLSLLEGRHALVERLHDTTFGDVMIIIEDITAADDRVVVRATWQAVQHGPFYGVNGTGARVMLDIVTILRITNGRIVEDSTYFDVYSLFEQLGALPPVDQLMAPKRLAPVLKLVP